MRIRKRFPPSSSVLPLSDPQLNRSLGVQQPHQHGNRYLQEDLKTNPNSSDPQNQQPTNQETRIRTENSMWACHQNTVQVKMKQKEIEEGKEIKDERLKEEEQKRSNDIRKESILSAEVDTQFPQPISSSSHQDIGALERWCEGDKVVPLKKRKGSFERIASQETVKVKMKSKTNKKCLQQNDTGGQEQEEKKETKETVDHSTKNKNISASVKKSKRGNVIMEGSRCSRVNGSGWRCCQQTLVGYSLCEHHLGKGRLRSITSVRNRAMANQITGHETVRTLPRLEENQQPIELDVVEEDDDERKPLIVTKKRMKLGVMKARSLSSLLGQTDSKVLAANSSKK